MLANTTSLVLGPWICTSQLPTLSSELTKLGLDFASVSAVAGIAYAPNQCRQPPEHVQAPHHVVIAIVGNTPQGIPASLWNLYDNTHPQRVAEHCEFVSCSCVVLR